MPVQTSQRKKTIRGLSQHVADLKLKFEFSGKEENLKKNTFALATTNPTHNLQTTPMSKSTAVALAAASADTPVSVFMSDAKLRNLARADVRRKGNHGHRKFTYLCTLCVLSGPIC